MTVGLGDALSPVVRLKAWHRTEGLKLGGKQQQHPHKNDAGIQPTLYSKMCPSDYSQPASNQKEDRVSQRPFQDSPK